MNSLYQPIQTEHFSDNSISYKEVLVDVSLRSYIRCYWELSTTERLEKDFIYKIIPDGCIDILWSIEEQKNIYLSGYSTSYSDFPLQTEFKYFGIRFLPLAFPLISNLDTKTIVGEFFSLKTIFPKLSENLRVLTRGKTNLSEMSEALNDYFTSEFKEIETKVDLRLVNAVHQIYSTKGVISIERDLDTGLSIRQLRRLFHHYIGTSPKVFSQIVKFQTLYQMSEDERQRFYHLAYYDQAHYIKSFKKMTMFTPKKK